MSEVSASSESANYDTMVAGNQVQRFVPRKYQKKQMNHGPNSFGYIGWRYLCP
jgi:hypothetical protein